MLKPPTHRIDHDPVLISEHDSAWDHDRIERELADLEDTSAHPVMEYRAGVSRYDLAAQHKLNGSPCVLSDYLQGQPTRFLLRRLSPEEMAEISYKFRSRGLEDLAGVYEFAARRGLKDVENLEGFKLVRYGDEVSSDSMQKLYDIGGMPLVSEIGGAVWSLSQPLSAAEKKR